jgi:hypothetical protein
MRESSVYLRQLMYDRWVSEPGDRLITFKQTNVFCVRVYSLWGIGSTTPKEPPIASGSLKGFFFL